MPSSHALFYRITVTIINIIFPPLAVAIIAGVEWDCLLNICLLFLGVIPAQVHGFWISTTYFHRRAKIRKGRYPGGPKPFIRSREVLNGGASDEKVARLFLKERGIRLPKGRAVSVSRAGSGSRHFSPNGRRSTNRQRSTNRRRSTSRAGSASGYGGRREREISRVGSERIGTKYQ